MADDLHPACKRFRRLGAMEIRARAAHAADHLAGSFDRRTEGAGALKCCGFKKVFVADAGAWWKQNPNSPVASRQSATRTAVRQGAPMNDRRAKTEGRRLTATRASIEARVACARDSRQRMLQLSTVRKSDRSQSFWLRNRSYV